jgi:hypothetical protein
MGQMGGGQMGQQQAEMEATEEDVTIGAEEDTEAQLGTEEDSVQIETEGESTLETDEG